MKKALVLIASVFIVLPPASVTAQMPLQSSHQPAPAAAATSIPTPAKPPTAQIARVNGVAVTQAQLDEEIKRLFPYYAIHGGRVPAGAEAELHKQAVHDAVLHELLYQEARRRNLQVPAATWQKRISEIRRGFSSRQAYDEAAKKQYGSPAEFERRLRRVMLVEQFWNTEVIRKSAVTEQEVKAYYESHRSQYLRPEAVWLQTITIKFPSTATPAQKQEARKIAEQVLVKAKAAKNYEEFGVLAEQLSQDDWRVMMGDHRWVHRGTVTKDIEGAVFSLKTGEISGLVETATGFLILRANEHQAQRQMPFDEMKASVRQGLEKEKRNQRSKEFEQALRRNAKVEIL